MRNQDSRDGRGSDTSHDALGDPVAHVTRVTLGGAELPGATVWARPDYTTDSGLVTVVFSAHGPRWQSGTHAVLDIRRSDGRAHEIAVRVEHERWLGDVERMTQLRLRVVGAAPWSEVEELLESERET